MSRRENKQLDTHVGARRLLFVDRTIGKQEGQRVQCDECKGDDRPPSSLHVFVTQWDEQDEILLPAIREWALGRDDWNPGYRSTPSKKGWLNEQVGPISQGDCETGAAR